MNLSSFMLKKPNKELIFTWSDKNRNWNLILNFTVKNLKNFQISIKKQKRIDHLYVNLYYVTEFSLFITKTIILSTIFLLSCISDIRHHELIFGILFFFYFHHPINPLTWHDQSAFLPQGESPVRVRWQFQGLSGRQPVESFLVVFKMSCAKLRLYAVS